MCCPDLPSRTRCPAAGSCQWATLNHQPLWGQRLCNDPSRGRYKGLVIGHVRTTLKSHLHSELPWGHLRSPGQCSSLIFASALSLLIPPMLMLGAPLINIPVLNSIWVQPREPICNQYKKNPSIWGGFFLTIIMYLHTCNILKSKNRIQSGGNKDFACHVVLLWLKILNLIRMKAHATKFVNTNLRIYWNLRQHANLLKIFLFLGDD